MWDTYTIHFGPKKIDQVGRGGQGRFKIWPLNGSKTPEMDLNQSEAVGGTIWIPFHLSRQS